MDRRGKGGGDIYPLWVVHVGQSLNVMPNDSLRPEVVSLVSLKTIGLLGSGLILNLFFKCFYTFFFYYRD